MTWLTYALLSALFAAATAVLAKAGLRGLDPDFATLIRTAVILLFLGAWIFLSRRWVDLRNIPGASWTFLILSGLATGGSWLCYYRALKLADVSKVAPIDKLSVVLVAVFGVLFLGEHPSPREWTGIALITVGVLTLALKP